MVEQEQSAPKEPALCEECKKNPSKYKCPGCSLRTCSLPCVNSHKQRTSCTGKKQYNEVVPFSQFDDNLLLSDYNMLEEVKRVADSGRRMRLKKPTYYRLPRGLKLLRNAADSRGTKLLFFSSGMSKREKNKSFYNPRSKSISWTIEWKFHSTDVLLTDHRVDEKGTLCSVIETHLKPGPWNHQLRPFCEEPLDALKFFIRTNPKGVRSPYRKLNIYASIREQLANLVILEYPVIYVFLPSQRYDFEVVDDTTPCEVEEKKTVKNDDLCQPGIVFKEEEIEGGCSSDPRVSDLIEIATQETEATAKPNVACDSKFSTEEIQESVSKNDVCNNIEGISDSYNHCTIEDSLLYSDSVYSDLDMNFDQGWRGIYSDMTADNMLEDFLNINGVPAEEACLLDGMGQADFTFPKEELEEGEIAE